MSILKTYEEIPSKIEAVRWDGSQELATALFKEGCPVVTTYSTIDGSLFIKNDHGFSPIQALVGDYIYRDENGIWKRFRNQGGEFNQLYREIKEIPVYGAPAIYNVQGDSE